MEFSMKQLYEAKDIAYADMNKQERELKRSGDNKMIVIGNKDKKNLTSKYDALNPFKDISHLRYYRK